MQKSKLVEVFRMLSGAEKRRFGLWVRSPFFNQQEKLVELWDYLIDHQRTAARDYDRDRVVAALYPDASPRPTELPYLLTDLLMCLEEYLAYTGYRAQPGLAGLFLTRAYREKKLAKHYQHARRSTHKRLQKKARNANYYQLCYELEIEEFNFSQARKRVDDNNVQEMGRALDELLLFQKLKQSCVYLAHAHVFKAEYDHSFLPQLLEYLADSPHLQEPSIAIYYYCYRALSEGHESDFQDFRRLLFEYQSHFASSELRDLFQLGINYCIKQVIGGVRGDVAEALALYRLGLENRFMHEQGYLRRFAYKNIVALGLHQGEYDWVEDFIQRYAAQLQPHFRRGIYNYNLAKLYYARKDFRATFKYLAAVDESDLLLNFGAKVMQVKMYYELHEYDALEALLASFKALLQRKKVLSYHRTHFSNIIQFTRRLLYLSPGDTEKANGLRKDILAAEVLSERDWLLEQLDQWA